MWENLTTKRTRVEKKWSNVFGEFEVFVTENQINWISCLSILPYYHVITKYTQITEFSVPDSCNFKTFILIFFTWDYLKLVCVRKLAGCFESSWFSFKLSWKKQPPKICTQPLREVRMINGVLWPFIWVDCTKTVHIHISLDDLLYSIETNVISHEYLRLVEENICTYSWIQKWSSVFKITVATS